MRYLLLFTLAISAMIGCSYKIEHKIESQPKKVFLNPYKELKRLSLYIQILTDDGELKTFILQPTEILDNDLGVRFKFDNPKYNNHVVYSVQLWYYNSLFRQVASGKANKTPFDVKFTFDDNMKPLIIDSEELGLNNEPADAER